MAPLVVLPGGGIVASCWRHSGVMVVSQWRFGGVMVALVYAFEPEYPYHEMIQILPERFSRTPSIVNIYWSELCEKCFSGSIVKLK